MASDVYRDAFMRPIDEVLNQAIHLGDFLEGSKAAAYRTKVQGVKASIKLLVDGNVVVQDDVSPELRQARERITELELALTEERANNRRILQQTNQEDNKKFFAAEQKNGELVSELAALKGVQRQLDKVSARLRLARELVQDLREVVVPLHQQLQLIRQTALHTLTEAEGLNGIDIRKLLKVSRLLVNEVDKSRDEGVRAREGEELDAHLASAQVPLPTTRMLITRRERGKFTY